MANYVESGEVKIVFWPVINHGNPSVYATATMECVGQQDPLLAWEAHEDLFESQRSLWSADLDFYVTIAEEVGADREAFISCYGDQATIDHVMQLDGIRRERGITGQPVFDFNGVGYLLGAQPIETFESAIETVQNQ